MTVPDYPPGEWSVLLVGAQWVSITSVTALTNAIANRGTIQTNFSQLHDTLQNAITTTLTGQEGLTADAIRDAFRQGAEQAAKIAEKNGAYKKALQDALDSVQRLRDKLTGIANDGNKQINDELQSKDNVATQVTKIAQIIADHQRQANQAAADCAFSIIGAGQGVLDAQGTGQSFFGLARDAGIDANQQPNLNAIEDQVRGKLEPLTGGGTGGPAPAAPGGTTAGRTSSLTTGPGPAAPAAPGGTTAARTSNLTTGPGPPVPAAPMTFAGSAPTAGPGLAPPMSAMPSAPMTGMPAGLAGANPTNVASGLNNALPTSAPTSPGAPALSGGPVQPIEPQVPPTAPTIPAAATGTPVTVGDTPPPAQQVPAPPVPPSSVAYTSEPVSPMMSGAAATPVAASGPLPAYGSDLRPPIAVTPSGPPIAASVPSAPVSPPPSSSVSGSAPVHPSAGGAPGVGQPAVVRQPTVPTPAQSPPGVGAQGVIATAGGALAGAASADATGRRRLQRLVAAVARQQPRLAWAVGDRSDDSTVLVTDLASGWIPPGIEIPSAVTLLKPVRRRGDLETLLGEVKLAAATEPGHYRPYSDADEPVPTSPRRRHAPEVEELSWQLTQATHWRDGLTRLAHTLATAASKNTGVLESEATDLHDQLTQLAHRVLDSYPDHVNPDEVGNWQLLSAIEALVVGDKTAANYHLAWFLACNTAAAESVSQ
jgi:Family of unknown function (DUF5632)/Family of unknown function (DUF5631)